MAFDHIRVPKGGRVSQPIRKTDVERIRGLELENSQLRQDQARGWDNNAGEVMAVHTGWGKYSVVRGVVVAEGLSKAEAEAHIAE